MLQQNYSKFIAKHEVTNNIMTSHRRRLIRLKSSIHAGLQGVFKHLPKSP